MSITDYEALDALCAAGGIAGGYHDIWNNYRQPGTETKLSLLDSLGEPVSSDADIYQALERRHAHGWDRTAAAALVVAENEAPIRVTLTLRPDQLDHPIRWRLDQENGETQHGEWSLGQASAIDERSVNGILLKRFEVLLVHQPANGYHQLHIMTADGATSETSLIVTPGHCYHPADMNHDHKLWGVALQLYTLRSQRNQGIGDFGDLNNVIEILAPLGVDIIGLNPLHALFPHRPEEASPYSPTSRDYLNPVYLHIETIDEFEHCEEVQLWLADGVMQTRLAALRDARLVDYSGVWAVKLKALKMLYQCFRDRHIASGSARARAFRQFQLDGGDDLHEFGVFEALQALLHRQDSSVWCWLLWPSHYSDPDSDTIADWVESNREEIEFHQYLQWNTELQLDAAQKRCTELGMRIGIYRDLAVGVAREGAQTWAEQSLYALYSSAGAPPDDFNLHGQNWSLPPLKPRSLANNAYRPFIKTLRANMRHTGALRIDHVMGLMRLFWVPPEGSPESGTYVSYPFADLLKILALESQRNQCMVIGEDLGTVPDEVRHALACHQILSYRILYFEKNWHEGSFKSPSDYPQQAVAMVGSHDLPTLTGFWQERDLELKQTLDLFPSPELRDQQQQVRRNDKSQIVAALRRENLGSPADSDDQHRIQDLCGELILPVHRYLARSNAMLMLFHPDDLFGQVDQVNLPGTIDQHPNWRRKLRLNIEDWLEQGNLSCFAQAIRQERENR